MSFGENIVGPGESTTLRESAGRIVKAALRRVEPSAMTRAALSVTADTLRCAVDGKAVATIRLNDFDRVLVLGFGKAAAHMARGVEHVLGSRITDGLVITKYGHTTNLERVRVREAAHPVPDDNGFSAASELAQLAEAADERTLVINLVSGGGSALLTLPYRDDTRQVSLEDLQSTTAALLRAGADITEINTVRKHLSAVKGGRLASLLAPAVSVSLLLSDVVGDDLSSIASGPTVGDTGTFVQAHEIIARYELLESLPPAVARLISDGMSGKVPDTPRPGDAVFERAFTAIIGSNAQALLAAAEAAAAEGFEPVVLSSRVEGEAREIAHFYTALAADAPRLYPHRLPLCFIAGGETTVTVRGTGLGGRNQEMAVSALLDMARHPAWYQRALCVAVATDGTDGPTDAAGGFADLDALERLAPSPREAEAVIRPALAENDAYHVLSQAEALIKTGPTGTNVCDIQLVLRE